MLKKLTRQKKIPFTMLVMSFLLIALGQPNNEILIALKQQDSAYLELTGLSEAFLQTLKTHNLTTEQWQDFFKVSIMDEKIQSTRQAMLGSYSIKEEGLRFAPQFPLMAGQTYQATITFQAVFSVIPELLGTDSSKLQQEVIISEFVLSKPDTAITEVIDIFPSADLLPENLLRFYIYFSAPMREGFVAKTIHLLDAQGQSLEGIFFNAVFELWDPSMQRLTLLFDPGRVKTGLRAHEELGRALTVGETYRLQIAEGMLDASGNSLGQAFEKTFTVTQAELNPPDVTLWDISSPRAGGTDALTVRFPAPLDHALLIEFVQVHDAAGERIHGEIALEHDETVWHFIPTLPWQTGSYNLFVNTSLEDIAGNNLHGLFDTPAEQLILLDKTEVSLAFQVEP